MLERQPGILVDEFPCGPDVGADAIGAALRDAPELGSYAEGELAVVEPLGDLGTDDLLPWSAVLAVPAVPAVITAVEPVIATTTLTALSAKTVVPAPSTTIVPTLEPIIATTTLTAIPATTVVRTTFPAIPARSAVTTTRSPAPARTRAGALTGTIAAPTRSVFVPSRAAGPVVGILKHVAIFPCGRLYREKSIKHKNPRPKSGVFE
ncbi:MAG: hypothetical protein GX596_05350 [Propionibacterium sp.]|nr:hypothetical protein [Propionibacterium sp.]